MTVPDQHLLWKWIDDVQAVTAKYSEIKISGAYRWMHVLSEKPLRFLEGIIPNDILGMIEDGQRFMFENAVIVSNESVTSASTSKVNEVLELTDIHDVISEGFLNAAADLAVNQLIQTLLMCNIHHVRFFTRNNTEKVDVKRKIVAALNDMQNKKKISYKYSRVLWIDVSNYRGNAEVGVQQEIVQRLNLVMTRRDQTDDNDILLTRRIEEEMMSKKHLVLLVDGDGHEKLDPRKVGFPTGTLAGAMVLLTTDSSGQERDELTMSMDLEIRTDDHLLPWELFIRNVGSELLVHSSSAIQTIAMQMVECHGHLLTIILVAKSLKNVEDVERWKCARDDGTVMLNEVINFIWNSIDEKTKHCLKCCLFVPGIKDRVADDVLISSWAYEELLNSRDEAEDILRNLVDRSILLQFEGRYIRLPEETYDILKSLLQLHPSDEIKQGGLGLTEPPNVGVWPDARKIELMDNKLSDLPLSPACPELEVLLLQGNAYLMEIPPSFFRFMPHLLVLDLSYTSIRSLPISFSALKELRELHLKGCKRFMELPPNIGGLTNLEMLNLDGTPIIYLPQQIQELTKLRKLIVSLYPYTDHDMNNMQYPVPPGVMSKLTQLQHLRIDVNPDDKLWSENVQVMLQDISGLQDLRTLNLYIPQVEILKHVPFHRKLDFRFVVGRHRQRIILHAPPGVEAIFKRSHFSLKFVNSVNIPRGIDKVLGRTKTLFLERNMTIKHLSEFEMDNLKKLRVCIVGECKEMQTLFDEGSSLEDPLPNLRFLLVFYMSNLRSICQGPARFRRLKTIALHTCPNLTTIFTLNFLDNLSYLEELIVKDCPKVSTLISHELSKPTDQRVFLPRLRKALLLYLPELVSISSGLCIGPGLERIGFYGCPKLRSLSSMELSSRHLKLIEGENRWWDTLTWEEADWGKEGRPNYLHHIFTSINEEADIMDQLVRDDSDDEASLSSPSDEECFPSNEYENQNTFLNPPDLSIQTTPEDQILHDPLEAGSGRQFPAARVKKDCKITKDDQNKRWNSWAFVERQRRQQMATLYASLRSLLPLEYIKGKRSMSDHLYEAVNYIKHLQNKVEKLKTKKHELQELQTIPLTNLKAFGPHDLPIISIHPCKGVVNIACSCSLRTHVFPQSMILNVLYKDGLNVVSSCLSKMGDMFLHTIQLEDTDMAEKDCSELQRKLTRAILLTS